MSEELKPCPFCGGDAVFKRHSPQEESCRVVCPSCILDGPKRATRTTAVEAWNRRAAQGTEQRLRERIKALWNLALRLPDADYGEQKITAEEIRKCIKTIEALANEAGKKEK